MYTKNEKDTTQPKKRDTRCVTTITTYLGSLELDGTAEVEGCKLMIYDMMLRERVCEYKSA